MVEFAGLIALFSQPNTPPRRGGKPLAGVTFPPASGTQICGNSGAWLVGMISLAKATLA